MNQSLRIGLAVIVMLLALSPASQAGDAEAQQVWNFAVTLDGQSIGTHSFTLFRKATEKDIWYVTSQANLVVTFFHIPVYRYRHVAEEKWKDQCLANLTADTDDDGDTTSVKAMGSPRAGRLLLVAGADDEEVKEATWSGCLMTFAYWNPQMCHQTHLLNPQTGDIEDVTITEQAPETFTENGKEVEAKVYRVVGKHEPVNVLYTPDGRWVGLDATVKGGHVLSYRLL